MGSPLVGDTPYSREIAAIYREVQEDSNSTRILVVETLDTGVFVKFDKARLHARRGDIRRILEEVVQPEFRAEAGGGWTFSRFHIKRDGKVWAGPEETLFMLYLAMGLTYAKYVYPREMWETLPLGLPYITINTRPN